jgi:hypothetical protein
MKRINAILLAAMLVLSLLSACGQTAEPPVPSPGESEAPPEPRYTVGEGAIVYYTVTSGEAEIEITGCPSYGDKNTPFVYGKLTKGDPFAYELITIIMVGGSYYGKKPFNNSPNGVIKSDGGFQVQYSSNDGMGADWNADNIFIFLVPGGYKDEIDPDVDSGYIVPPSQVASLRENSICVVQIDRVAVTP